MGSVGVATKTTFVDFSTTSNLKEVITEDPVILHGIVIANGAGFGTTFLPEGHMVIGNKDLAESGADTGNQLFHIELLASRSTAVFDINLVAQNGLAVRDPFQGLDLADNVQVTVFYSHIGR